MNMEFLKNLCVIIKIENELYEILKFLKENTNIKWNSNKELFEFIPEDATALFIKKENDNFILLYSTLSHKSIFESFSNEFKIITFEEFKNLIKLETIEIIVNKKTLDIQIILPEDLKNKLKNKNLNNLKKGLKKSLKKILEKHKDNPFKMFEMWDKEILKTKKKILSKIEEQKYKELEKVTIPKRNVKLDNGFVKLLKFIFYKENEFENLLNKLNTNEKTLITEIKLNEEHKILEVTYVNGDKEYKQIKKFIENFLNIKINPYRNLLIKGFFRMKNYEFEITNEVCYYYNEDRYEDDDNISLGSLYKSCMKYDDCQEFIKFYEKEGIKLLILKNRKKNLIIGRALLWEDTIDIESNKIFKFIDRIYGDDITISLFKRWAYLNGYAHKKVQKYNNKNEFVFKGEKVTKKLKYKLKNDINVYKNSGMPYMDTMTFLDINNNSLYNYETDNTFELTDTEGNFESLGFFVCEECGECIPEDEVYWIGNTPYCEYCFDNLVIGRCKECGEIILYDDEFIETITGDVICERCWDGYVYCQDKNAYVKIENAYYSKVDGCYYYCKDCMPENNSNG